MITLVDKNDPILYKEAMPVPEDMKQHFIDLAEEVFTLMQCSGWVGLAAPQFGESYKCFYTCIPMKGGTVDKRIWINPEILSYDKSKRHISYERCASNPGKEFKVYRPNTYTMRYTNGKNEVITINMDYEDNGRAHDIYLHEYNHLKGKVIWRAQ